MNEWQNAWDEFKHVLEADIESYSCQDNVEAAIMAKYGKELLRYMKQIEPRESMDELRDKFLG
jgi:hypothetical protein